jgi:hypothetical protein
LVDINDNTDEIWYGRAGHEARMEEMRHAYKVLVGKPKGNRLLGRRRWEGNIRTDLREAGWEFIWLRKRTSGGVL